MGKPRNPRHGGYDIPQKELESYPDVFADIVNALVYGGEQVVDLRRLRPAETETRYRDRERRLDQEINHPVALLELLEALSGDGRYKIVIESLMKEEKTGDGGKWTVCKLMDKYWGGGKQEGLKEGRKEGLKEGKREGLKEGKREGLKEGKQEERQTGIRVLISTCHEIGASFETTAGKLKEKYGLEDSQVKESMTMYW